MRPRLFPVLATGVLALSLLGPTGRPAASPTTRGGDRRSAEPAAAASDPGAGHRRPGRGAGDSSTERPRRGGARAAAPRAVSTPRWRSTSCSGCATTSTGAERAQADALLARPDRTPAEASSATPTRSEGGDATGVRRRHLRPLRPARPATLRPAPTTDGNGVPDAVDQALATARQCTTCTSTAGYRRPDWTGKRGPATRQGRHLPGRPGQPGALRLLHDRPEGHAPSTGGPTAGSTTTSPPSSRATRRRRTAGHAGARILPRGPVRL